MACRGRERYWPRPMLSTHVACNRLSARRR